MATGSPPILLCPNFPRDCAIHLSFSCKNPISKCVYSEISVSAKGKIITPIIRRAESRSSLDSPGELDEGAPSAIIFIKGLAQSTPAGLLREAFSQFGEVCRVKLITDKKTKQSLGFAYVWFTREEHARAAVDTMNGEFFDGRFVRVEIAKPGSCVPRSRPRPYRF